MVKARFVVAVAAQAILLVGAGACSAPTAEDEGVSEDLVVADEDLAGEINVLPDRLEVPRDKDQTLLVAMKRGKRFIAGGPSKERSPRNPLGFLRRVDSFEETPDKLVLRTSPAALDEVIENADFKPVRADGTILTDGTQIRTQALGGDGLVDFSGKQLYDGDVGGVHLNARITKGELRFSPDVQLDAKISWFRLKRFNFVVGGQAEAKVDVGVTADGPLSKEFETSFNVGNAIPVGSIGPVPLTARVAVRLACKIEGQTNHRATAGIDASIKVQGGVRYEGGDWSPVSQFEPQLAPRFGISGNGPLTARCSAGPVVSLLVADLVGPAVEVAPYLDVRTNDADIGSASFGADYDLGLDARLHGKVQILGRNLVDLDTTLYSHSFKRGTFGSAGLTETL